MQILDSSRQEAEKLGLAYTQDILKFFLVVYTLSNNFRSNNCCINVDLRSEQYNSLVGYFSVAAYLTNALRIFYASLRALWMHPTWLDALVPLFLAVMIPPVHAAPSAP